MNMQQHARAPTFYKNQKLWVRIVILVALSILLTAQDKGGNLQGGEKKEVKTYKFSNRLAQEKSPYLLQHAHNPVDWYPWGKEAFAKAKKENKPIFLSIGYSTCHWCHVMEKESFENEEIAQ